MDKEGIMYIHRPGFFTTIQDVDGRIGWRNRGVPVSGAMDQEAVLQNHYILNNPDNTPILEVSYQGPVLEFTKETICAVTGAKNQIKVNGEEKPMNTLIHIQPGDQISIGKVKKGFRSYFGFAGEWLIPKIMNSYSTYVDAGIGGWKGRSLQPGDRIPYNPRLDKLEQKNIHNGYYSRHHTLRILPGPEFHWFSQKSLTDFEIHRFNVSKDTNRMGIRLVGPKVALTKSVSMISSGIIPGTIQIPPGGNPVIITADGQTVGGYPRLGIVVSRDISLLGQIKPGDFVRFQYFLLEDARKLLLGTSE